MSIPPRPAVPERTGRVRWQICSLLFAATALTYVDRQPIGVLEPYLAQQLHWPQSDYVFFVFVFLFVFVFVFVVFCLLFV